MKINLAFICLCLILWATVSQAAPSITSTSGTVADGEAIVISGSSFGANAAAGTSDLEWLGGASGNIESGTDGNAFSATDWLVDTDTNGFYPPKYSTAEKHSHSQSIIVQWPAAADYGCGFSYDNSSKFTTIYATWWAYFDHDDAQGQWKIWRISPDSATHRYTDQEGQTRENQFFNTDGSILQAEVDIYCVMGYPAVCECWPSETCATYSPAVSQWPVDTWVRYEVYAVASSEAAARDAVLQIYSHNQSVSPHTVKDLDGTIISRKVGTPEWRYWTFQNYWGNIEGGDGTKEKAYIDDIFLQFGTQSRVEIGNNATFANCSHREIQIPTAWAAGEITFTLNQGTISDAGLINGNYYLFVIDVDGTPSAGHQLTGKSAALTGSATDGVTEAEIVAGSEEIIITLTNDTFVATAGADNQFTTDLIAAIDSGGAEAAGWDVQVKGTLAHGDFTRTSDTVMTIVLPAVAAYEITTNETITIAIPANNLTGAAIITTPTFEVTAASDPAAALTGTFADNALEAEIVTGGEDIIITLTNDTWVAAGGTFDGIRQDIIDGIDSAQSETTGWDNEVKGKEVVTAVVRTNATTVTITLTAQAAYDISANETITVTIPASALVTSGSPIVATPTADIVFFDVSTEKCVGMTLQ